MVANVADFPMFELPNDWPSFFQQQRCDESSKLYAFYQQELASSEQKIEQTQMVALDIETTGLNPKEDEIVSVGLVPFDASRIYCNQAKYWVVRTEKLRHKSITIHGITHSEVAKAPSLEFVLSELLLCLAGRQVVVHYRFMEREFLRQATARLWHEVLLFPVIDTFELETNYVRQKQSAWHRLINRKLPSSRLPTSRDRYNLPAYTNHNALIDALATAELMQAQIQYWSAQKNATRSWWR